MKGKAGTIARVGVLAVMALLLSGCIKLTMDLDVNADNTVSGTVQLGIQKELLELSGGSVSDILGSDSPFPSDAPGVTVTEFDDGEFAGQEFTFDSVPLDEFQDPSAADSLSITREGDNFVVNGVLDMSTPTGASGLTGPFGASGAELFNSAVIRITMSFPGAVAEASGTIDGNSVTWEPRFGERTEITATASAIDNGQQESSGGGDDGSSSTLMIVLIVVGVLVLLAIVAYFVMKNRNKGGGEGGEVAMAGAPTAPMTGEAPPPAAPPAPPEPPAAPPAP